MSTHAIAGRIEPSHVRLHGPVTPATHTALEGAPSLPPSAGPAVFVGDLQSMMYEATIANRSAQESTAQATVHSADATRDQQMRAAKEAEDRARKAAESSSSWGNLVKVASTVATVAAAVGLCASAVMSGGATAPVVLALAGTLLTTGSGTIAKATGSDDLGKVCLWGGMAMSVGAGGYQAIAGEAVKQGELTTAQHIARYAAPIARAVEGGARVTQGGATIEQKSYDAEVVDDLADALAARAAAKEAQAQIDAIVDALQSLEASVRRAIGTVMATGNEVQRTRAELVARIGRSVVA